MYLKADGTVACYGLTHLTLVCEPVRCVRPKSVINYRIICSIHSFRTFYHFALYPLFNWERSILTSVHRTRKLVRSDESTPVCQRLKNVLILNGWIVLHSLYTVRSCQCIPAQAKWQSLSQSLATFPPLHDQKKRCQLSPKVRHMATACHS